jgi:hypothetical protein
MDPGIISALIAAAVSLAVGIYSMRVGHANERKLETLRDSLAEKRAERDAWRDYQYEARKRLYEECEPLFFQLREASEIARDRICSLAERARQGRLGEREPSLLEREGHYAVSTYYQLMIPVTIFKMLQRRLTGVDLTVDPIAKTRYELAKWLYISFASEYVFADAHPAIEYTPDQAGRKGAREQNPSQFWRQGLPRARIDAIAETLVVRDDTNNTCCMTYGDFETGYFDEKMELQSLWSPMANIFHLFHPRTRPVLWRMLITQAYFHTAIIELSRPLDAGPSVDLPQPVRKLTADERKKYDWRLEGEDLSDDCIAEPFAVAETILMDRLPELCRM